MRKRSDRILWCGLILWIYAFFALAFPAAAQNVSPDPLPSWSDGATKQAILSFVQRVTKQGSADFIPQDARIAAFDNDGTLWTEQPLYTEFVFTFDRVQELAPQHPAWKTEEPYASVLRHDKKGIMASGNRGLFRLVASTHAGMTEEQFSQIVNTWLAHAEQPRFHRPYTACVYQPMLELLAYLRANGFKIYIASGGETGFIRAWSEKIYGIPPEQVIGTTLKNRYELNGSIPSVERLAEIDSIDDGPGKPENISKFVGRRPVIAFGNSDGDKQMLEWTAGGPGTTLCALIHHTDAEREYSYDRNSSVGRLDKALDEAMAKHWLVVDMKEDWKAIFPPQNP